MISGGEADRGSAKHSFEKLGWKEERKIAGGELEVGGGGSPKTLAPDRLLLLGAPDACF